MTEEKLVKRTAQEIIASFPGWVAVDLRGLHCRTAFGYVVPGEPGYYGFNGHKPDETALTELDAILIRKGLATRPPTDAERKAARVGSMFGWGVPGADPLNNGPVDL